MQILFNSSFSSKAYLQIRFFKTQALNCFVFIDKTVKIKLNGVEHLVVCNAANYNIIVGVIFAAAAKKNKIKPFFGIRIEPLYFEFVISIFVKFIAGYDTVLTAALKFFTPFYRLIIKGCGVKSNTKIYVGSGVL